MRVVPSSGDGPKLASCKHFSIDVTFILYTNIQLKKIIDLWQSKGADSFPTIPNNQMPIRVICLQMIKFLRLTRVQYNSQNFAIGLSNGPLYLID